MHNLHFTFIYRHIYSATLMDCCGPSSSVGAATGYGLDGPGIESRLVGAGWRRRLKHRAKAGKTQVRFPILPNFAGPSGRAVYAVGLRPLAC